MKTSLFAAMAGNRLPFAASFIRANARQQRPRNGPASLEPAKLLDSFLDGLELFDHRVHGVLLEIHLLGERKHFWSKRARHHDDAIRVRNDNVSGTDFDSVTNDTDI